MILKKYLVRFEVLLLKFGIVSLILFTVFSCKNEEKSPPKVSEDQIADAPNTNEAKKEELAFQLFTKLDPSQSAIHFKNSIKESNSLNYFSYEYIYNGGGVAIGDINNDGLPDLFFTANMSFNRLYLNKGNLQFEDISATAGVRTQGDWSTGVTMADVNGDGFLDIYVSQSGWFENPEQRRNKLFINNGDLTFSEQANNYGIDDPGYSTQAVFFDMDQDDITSNA